MAVIFTEFFFQAMSVAIVKWTPFIGFDIRYGTFSFSRIDIGKKLAADPFFIIWMIDFVSTHSQ